MLDDLLARTAPPRTDPRQLTRIAALAAGNPLFALELLRALPPAPAGAHAANRGSADADAGANGARPRRG